MFFVFLFISIFLMIIDRQYKRNILSPVFIFCLSWILMIGSYELKLIYYYNLSFITYLIVIISEIVFCLSCWVGFSSTKISSEKQEILLDSVEKKKVLHAIVICSILGSIPIVYGFFLLMRDFDYNFIRILISSDYLYAQHILHDNTYLKIPYLHAFAYVALVFSSFYLKKYGFKMILMYPVLLIGLLTIITGSRYFIVLGALQFICPLFAIKKNDINNKKNKKNSHCNFIDCSRFCFFFTYCL